MKVEERAKMGKREQYEQAAEKQTIGRIQERWKKVCWAGVVERSRKWGALTLVFWRWRKKDEMADL